MDNRDSTERGINTLQGWGTTVGGTIVFLVLVVIGFYMYMRWIVSRLAWINGPTGPDSTIVVVHQINVSDDANATSSSSSLSSLYPQFAYSEIGAHKIKESYASACSICLADYEEADLIRLLPSCGHLFHVKCIDPWLMLHPTCPVCRSSPSPTPPPPPPPPPAAPAV